MTGIVTITMNAILSKNTIETEVYNHLKGVATSRAHHIETLLNSHKELVEILATERTFIDIVTNKSAIWSVVYANERIKSLRQSEKMISKITVLDKNGDIVVSSHRDEAIDQTTQTEIFTYGQKNVYTRCSS